MLPRSVSLFAANCNSLLTSACNLPQPNTNDTINNVLNIVFGISASIAVLMVAINGFRYILARGDPGGTASAKNGILYSIVGLVVVMAAYSIVAFVVKGIS